jgi:phosphomevalonate kinase
LNYFEQVFSEFISEFHLLISSPFQRHNHFVQEIKKRLDKLQKDEHVDSEKKENLDELNPKFMKILILEVDSIQQTKTVERFLIPDFSHTAFNQSRLRAILNKIQERKKEIALKLEEINASLKEIFEKEDFIFCEYNFFHKTLKTS